MKNVVNILVFLNLNILFIMGVSYYYFCNLLIFLLSVSSIIQTFAKGS